MSGEIVDGDVDFASPRLRFDNGRAEGEDYATLLSTLDERHATSDAADSG